MVGRLQASLGNLGKVGLKTESKKRARARRDRVPHWHVQCLVLPGRQANKQTATNQKQTTNKTTKPHQNIRIDVFPQTSQPSKYKKSRKTHYV